MREVKVYGWVAREGDYNGGTVVGRFLRKHTILKTIDEVSKTESEKSREMVVRLAFQIEEKNRYLHDLETKKNATELSISHLEEDNRKLHEAYNEGNMCNFASFPSTLLDGLDLPACVT